LQSIALGRDLREPPVRFVEFPLQIGHFLSHGLPRPGHLRRGFLYGLVALARGPCCLFPQSDEFLLDLVHARFPLPHQAVEIFRHRVQLHLLLATHFVDLLAESFDPLALLGKRRRRVVMGALDARDLPLRLLLGAGQRFLRLPQRLRVAPVRLALLGQLLLPPGPLGL
jgi:hypothetical protein